MIENLKNIFEFGLDTKKSGTTNTNATLATHYYLGSVHDKSAPTIFVLDFQQNISKYYDGTTEKRIIMKVAEKDIVITNTANEETYNELFVEYKFRDKALVKQNFLDSGEEETAEKMAKEQIEKYEEKKERQKTNYANHAMTFDWIAQTAVNYGVLTGGPQLAEVMIYQNKLQTPDAFEFFLLNPGKIELYSEKGIVSEDKDNNGIYSLQVGDQTLRSNK
eukprot:gene3125-5295_t